MEELNVEGAVEGAEEEKSKDLEATDLQVEHNLNGAWSSGFCGCLRSPCSAIVTCLLPCWTFGRIANIVDRGGISCCTSAITCIGYSFCFGMTCKLTSQYRAKLRAMYGIPPGPAIDSVAHLCCQCCALSQEYRELKARGWDPSIGWKRNLETNPKLRNMMPPVNQKMRL